jgi:hypothetical protein
VDDQVTNLTPKEAIRKAKASVAQLFEEENVDDIRLEEIRFDDRLDCWMITIGFERPRRVSVNGLALDLESGRRDYKVVSISDATGKTIAISSWTEPRV